MPSQRTCSFSDCNRPFEALGYCDKHYRRVLRTGDPANDGRLSVTERFWIKVDRNGPSPSHRPELGNCWLWTASCDTAGYGEFKPAGREDKAHRWSYIQENGPVPDGLELDHLCRVRHCVRPSHLEPVTHWENCRRGTRYLPITRCKAGHEFTEANTYRDPKRGRRSCRICRELWVEQNRAKVRLTAARFRERQRAARIP